MDLVHATIVCWHCKRSDVTLKKVKADDNDYEDYVCVNCEVMFPEPPIGNCSKIYRNKPKEIQAESQ